MGLRAIRIPPLAAATRDDAVCGLTLPDTGTVTKRVPGGVLDAETTCCCQIAFAFALPITCLIPAAVIVTGLDPCDVMVTGRTMLDADMEVAAVVDPC